MSKQVGLLSRHAVSNYGSVLQAAALQRKLEEFDCVVEYINYRIKHDRPFSAARAEVGIMAPVKALPKWYGLQKFEKMRKGSIKQSRTIYGAEELSEFYRHYDALCVGSDQVWNVMSDGRIDGAYLLETAPKDVFKFTYASSFGKCGVLPIDENRVVKSLERFQRLSVREENGSDYLREKGMDSRLDVDPVHLLTPREWESFIGFSKPKQATGDFLLIYNLHPTRDFDDYVSGVLKKTGCKALSIRPTLRKSQGKNMFFPSLSEFLWCFRNAKCVLTDSFHGTSFSILFNTPFVEILPKEFSERNEAILKRYGLEERVDAFVGQDIFSVGSIDWLSVDAKLAENRAESIEYLHDVVNMIP